MNNSLATYSNDGFMDRGNPFGRFVSNPRVDGPSNIRQYSQSTNTSYSNQSTGAFATEFGGYGPYSNVNSGFSNSEDAGFMASSDQPPIRFGTPEYIPENPQGSGEFQQ